MNEAPPGKNIALIAYITFVGLIIAYYMNREERHEFATWHIKNMFALFLLLVLSMLTHQYVDEDFGDVLWMLSFVLWIFSILMAIINRKRAIPFFTEKFQQWFTFLD